MVSAVVANRRALVHEVSASLDAIEECYRRGWTDGLPVVPPTVDRVAEMLDYIGLAPDHVLGEVPVRRRHYCGAGVTFPGTPPFHDEAA